MCSESGTKVLRPVIHSSVFIAEGAKIYGDVEIGEGSSIWFNAVIRGDEGKVTIGKNTNIQDNVVIHSDDGATVTIGNNVTIGHGAVVRGCRVGNGVMVGMNSTVMSHAEIGDSCLIGANSLVPYRKKYADRSLVMGAPSKYVRTLSETETLSLGKAITIYSELISCYKDGKIEGVNKKRRRP